MAGFLARRPSRTSEALKRAEDVACHQGIDRRSVVGIEVTAVDEVVGQGAGLLECPGLEGGHELDLIDQAVLQREQAEEQVTVGGDGSRGAGLPEGRHGRSAYGPRCQEPPTRMSGSAVLSHRCPRRAVPRRWKMVGIAPPP
jgi:hypothetical protein